MTLRREVIMLKPGVIGVAGIKIAVGPHHRRRGSREARSVAKALPLVLSIATAAADILHIGVAREIVLGSSRGA